MAAKFVGGTPSRTMTNGSIQPEHQLLPNYTSTLTASPTFTTPAVTTEP
jgi:hypothetical protein